jgi:hypothetical protein
MHLIEKLFGFAPGRSDGSIEAIILIAVVTVVTGLAMGYFDKHYPHR